MLVKLHLSAMVDLSSEANRVRFIEKGRSSSTDFNPSSSAALGVTCLVGVFAIIALATPWSVFDYEVDGTNVRLEGRVFLDRVCYECLSPDDADGTNPCAVLPSTCVGSGVGGGTGSVITLALALVCIVAAIVADLGRMWISCLRPHRDVMVPGLVGLSSLLFMISFSIYSASSGSTVLTLSAVGAAETVTLPLSVAHTGAGFILTIFSWLISIFVIQPLFGFILTIFSWLISLFVIQPLFQLFARTHDFHNFVSHTSKATRSATLSNAGGGGGAHNKNLSVNPTKEMSHTENGVGGGTSSAEPSLQKLRLSPKAVGSHKINSSDMENGVGGGTSSAEPSLQKLKLSPKAVGSHKIKSSDMDLSRYLPRDMTIKTMTPALAPDSPPSHHHSMSVPPTHLSLAPPSGRQGSGRHVQSRSMDSGPGGPEPLPVVSSSAPSAHRSPLSGGGSGAFQSQRAPLTPLHGALTSRVSTDTRSSTSSAEHNDVRISISVNDVPQTGLAKGAHAPQVVAPVVLTPVNAQQ